jgi:hypothetical protein
MTTAPTPLAEPIEVAKWWKSRRRNIAIVVRRLPEFARALRQALETARKLDLLPEDGEGER